MVALRGRGVQVSPAGTSGHGPCHRHDHDHVDLVVDLDVSRESWSAGFVDLDVDVDVEVVASSSSYRVQLVAPLLLGPFSSCTVPLADLPSAENRTS